MSENQLKVVIVLNETVELGQLINAAAHLALGFGTSRSPSEQIQLNLLDFIDQSGDHHPNISGLSLIVLKGRPAQLVSLRAAARRQNTTCLDFTSSMTQGTFQEQLQRTRDTASDVLVYYGVLLFGSSDELHPLTKRFSLFRGREADNRVASPGLAALLLKVEHPLFAVPVEAAASQ